MKSEKHHSDEDGDDLNEATRAVFESITTIDDQ